MSETPPIPAPDIAAIPDDLKRKKQWICWRYEERDGKAVKVPIAPWVTGDTQPASVTDPNNIATFAQAITYAEKFNCGIGFVFFRGAGVTGIDLDHIDENLKDEADEILKKANSYAEYSPSCKGIHIIGCGVVNKPIKKPGLEIYSEDRFFTVTGHHVEGTPTTLNNIQALLDELQEKYGEKPRPVIEAKPVKGWEEHVNELGYTLKEVRERDKVLDEYLNGGLAGKPSDSEADMGALERLLFWGYTSDEAVSILKFYRQREKLKRDDYIRGMLDKLLPVRERASPKAQDVKLNDYRFEASGKNFFLYDSTGGVVYSNKVAYLNTKTVKKDLQKQTKADENEVNKAVALFLSQAKNEVKKSEGQKASSLPETPGKEAEVDQEAEELAEKILNTQDVLKALKEEALDNYLVGEDQNKQLAFILNFSGKYAKVEKKANQIVIFMGSSGVGKSALASLSRFFRTKEVGRFTEHALDYSDLSGFEILYLKELSRADDESQGVATMKFLSTEDQGYIIEYTVKDESGRFTTEEKKIPPITIVTTTTRVYVDSQFERRAWVVNPDESEEQTNRILKFKAKLKEQENEVKLGLRKRTDYDFASAVLRKIVEKVEAKEVVVPYPNALTELLSAKTLRARGDYDKVYTLIPLVALLYQRQLPTLKGKLVATPRICVEALEIGLEPLTTMTTDLDVRIRKVVVALKGKGITKKGDYVKRETRADVAKELGVSEKTVSRYLDQMEEKGYLTSMTDPDDKRRNIHMLMYDVDEILAKASSIQITPELGQQLGHQEMSMSRLENLYYETLQLVAKNCGQNGQVDKENISLLNQLWQEATSYGLDLNMYYQKLNLSQFLEQHETSNRDMDKSGAQNSVQNNTGEEQKSDTPNPPNTPETEGEISSNGGLNNPPESQLKCSSCLSWSKNRCELHPEWAVVTPDHPVCKDYQPKEEKET